VRDGTSMPRSAPTIAATARSDALSDTPAAA
jgi:hypothetical protein